jgi:hypothetical protein
MTYQPRRMKNRDLLLQSVVTATLFAFAIRTSSAQTSTGAPSPTPAIDASATDGHVPAVTTTVGTATATVDGREIIASGVSASVQTESDFARVQLDDHVLTVERDRLLVDGSERAKLPASAKKVQLSLSSGHLTVSADGQEVLSENLSK